MLLNKHSNYKLIFCLSTFFPVPSVVRPTLKAIPEAGVTENHGNLWTLCVIVVFCWDTKKKEA